MANSSTSFLRNNSKVPSFSSTIMNYKTVIKWEDIIKLYSVIINPDWYDSIISKPEDWLASLTYYPFDIYSTNVNTPFILKIGNHETNIVTKFIDDVHNRYYNVGEYYVTPILNNFADYNGYSKIEIYLPYFGLTDIHPNDCLNKWLQFRLLVDYNSGQGTYFIGVSDNSITDGDDSEVRIISILTFQLGVQIPINSVGMADLKRNLTLGTVKAGMSIASSLITGAFIPADTTTTHHEAIYGRSKAKGSRMKMLQGEYDTTTTSNSHRAERTSVNTAFEYSVEALNNMKLSPTTDRVNNPLGLYVGSESIQIIRYIPKIVDVDDAYNHIYGRPLGEVKTLNEIVGYTEVSRIHFENANFGSCTSTEYAMIEQLFTNGVILPDATVINFKVSTVGYKANKDMTWNEWISSTYNTDHFYLSNIKSGGVQYELVTIHNYEDNYIVVTYNGTPVTPNQLIVSGGAYETAVFKKDSDSDSDSIVGTWVFNDTINNNLIGDERYEFDFTSSGGTFTYFRIYDENVNGWIGYGGTYNNSFGEFMAYAYDAYGWDITDPNFQTIKILTEPTDKTFIAWLKANATKVEESVVGTWVLNEQLSFVDSEFAQPLTFYIDGSFYNGNYFNRIFYERTSNTGEKWIVGGAEQFVYYYKISKGNYSPIGRYVYDSTNKKTIEKVSDEGILYRTITITGGSDIENESFKIWLIANATKQ